MTTMEVESGVFQKHWKGTLGVWGQSRKRSGLPQRMAALWPYTPLLALPGPTSGPDPLRGWG